MPEATQSTNSVFFINSDSGIYVTDIRRTEDGLRGGVENGGWTLEITGKTLLALSGGRIMHRQEITSLVEVPVPRDIAGHDYKHVLNWARDQPTAPPLVAQ